MLSSLAPAEATSVNAPNVDTPPSRFPVSVKSLTSVGSVGAPVNDAYAPSNNVGLFDKSLYEPENNVGLFDRLWIIKNGRCIENTLRY